MYSTLSTPRAAPRRCSPRTPASASLRMRIGHGRSRAPARGGCRAGRRSSRGWGPSTRRRRCRRTMPATATPIPMIGTSTRPTEVGGERARSATTSSTDSSPRGRWTRTLSSGLAAQPDDRGGDRVDEDLEAQDRCAGRDEADERGGAARRARAGRRRCLGDEARRRRARRPASGSRCGSARSTRRGRSGTADHARGDRERWRKGSRGGPSRCAARCPSRRPARFVILSSKSVPDCDPRDPCVKPRSRGGPRWTARCAGGSCPRRTSRVDKVIPGMRRAAERGGPRHRVARAGRAPRRPPRPSASRGPMAATRRCWPTRTSTPCTSRCPTTSTPSGRSPRPGPASTSCARSRWR